MTSVEIQQESFQKKEQHEKEEQGGGSKEEQEERDEEARDDQEEDATVLSTEEEFHLVIERMKALVDIFKSGNNERDPSLIRERFEAVYHEDYVRYYNGTGDDGTDGLSRREALIEVQALACMPRLQFQLFRYKQAGDNCIDFELRFASDKIIFTLAGKSFYENAMIIRGELKRSVREKAAGEIWATSRKLTQSTTEREFGRRVQPLPSVMGGQLLGGGAGLMLPADDKYEMLRINLHYERGNLLHSVFRHNDLIKLTEGGGDQQQPYAGGAYFRFAKRKMGFQRSLTLFDANHNAIAFCERNDKAKAFTIFGTLPLVPGDHEYSAPRLQDVSFPHHPPGHGGSVVAFYPWFRVKGERLETGDNSPIGFVSALSDLSDAAETENNTTGGSHRGEVDFEPIYRMSSSSNHQDDKMVCIRDFVDNGGSDDARPVGLVRCDKDTSTGNRLVEVDIAPGIDPVMMLCIAACVAELRTRRLEREVWNKK